MQLFDLVRVYGAVPVVNKVLMAADREGAKDYNRESVETCVNQILSDLKEAANLLPTRKEWGSDQYGRLTKEAALAYRSRVRWYLQALSLMQIGIIQAVNAGKMRWILL